MLHAIALSVVLHLSNAAAVPAPVVEQAQAEAVRLFRDIGVDVEWSYGGVVRGTDPMTLRVVLLSYETGSLQRRPDTVMGAAVRTVEGTNVAYLFYRRVESEAAQYDVSPAYILACAIAHEVFHLLLPDRAHAPSGLMRACWDRDDFHRADRGQLRFSRMEVEQIRASLGAVILSLSKDNPPAVRSSR